MTVDTGKGVASQTTAAPTREIRKVLVANRGEIAVRIERALAELGMESVAVFSDADRTALHVRFADEAVRIGAGPSRESYLRIDKIIDAARDTGADAVHPGYGFLAENAEFAAAVEDAGLVFIGPDATAIERMGNKLEAHELAGQVGVPRVPSSDGAVDDAATAQAVAQAIGYPVMLKAAAGGGGKGMRVIESGNELDSALELVRGEARSAFGDDQVFIEKLVQRPHHVEVQIIADEHGRCVYLGERDCSAQRRHQKVVEESPSPIIDEDTRRKMGDAAVSLARAAGYRNAGTVEFLVDQDGSFFFLEMNTRLQVEHPVTEMCTRIDIVKEQLHVAAGHPLRIEQDAIERRGSAIEFRIYAEDPAMNFMPSLGIVRRFRLPSGPGIRNDAGIYPGYEIPIFYDPMIAKLIVWGGDRKEAIARARRALEEYMVAGVRTNLAFHRWIVSHPRFQTGDVDTGFIGEEWSADAMLSDAADENVAIIAAAIQTVEDRHRVGGGTAAETPVGNRWRFQNRPGGA